MIKRSVPIFVFAIAACNGPISPMFVGSHAASPYLANFAASSNKIQHVVFIIQENRSFDNLFQGYPGADTVPSGKNSNGQSVTLQPVSLATQYFLYHDL